MNTKNRILQEYKKVVHDPKYIEAFDSLLEDYGNERYMDGYDDWMTQILDLEPYPGLSAPQENEIHYVLSSDGRTRYKVEFNPQTEQITCECKAFEYSTDNMCKHIRSLTARS